MRSMKNIRFVALFVGLCLMLGLSGCASPSLQYARIPDQTKKVENPSRARLYVIRAGKFAGQGAPMRMRTEGRMKGLHRTIGDLYPGSYICWEEPPRLLKIQSVEGDPSASFELNMAAGQVYYVRVRIGPGFLQGKWILEQISAEEGESLLKQCKPPRGYQNKITREDHGNL